MPSTAQTCLILAGHDFGWSGDGMTVVNSKDANFRDISGIPDIFSKMYSGFCQSCLY